MAVKVRRRRNQHVIVGQRMAPEAFLKDIFFDVKWAYWLKDTIPGARRVIEVEDARLFFPEDRPDTLATPVLKFWDEIGR